MTEPDSVTLKSNESIVNLTPNGVDMSTTYGNNNSEISLDNDSIEIKANNTTKIIMEPTKIEIK